MEFSANFGFPNLHVAAFKKMVRYLEIKTKHIPTAEKALFKLLVKDIIDDVTDKRIEELWALRGKATREEKENKDKAILSENFSHCEGVLDDNDVKQVNDIVKEAKEQLRKKLAHYAERPSMAGVETDDRGSVIKLGWAQALLPPDCRLDKDDKLFWRWAGSMPKRVKKPKTFTRVWGGDTGRTEGKALRLVLETLWEWHSDGTEATKCPHDWDKLLP
eukprot:9474821-Pyramimonas_sp.AAC.1